MPRWIAALSVLAFAACSTEPGLALHPMRIEVEGEVGRPGGAPRPALVTIVDDDGSIRVGGELVGRITAEGAFLAPDGQVAARIDGDGRVFVRDVRTDGVIAADGTLENGTEHSMRIDPDGLVHGSHPGALRMRVTPMTPETRRTAMFVIVLGLLSDGSDHVSVGPVPALRSPT
ncbi:MAG: hypothetical protein M3Y87_25150 [Myxococcota bacterium]|nr:hypothetical protein [Myxococcota bacterium]